MDKLQKIAKHSLTVPTGTAFELKIPEGSREHLLRCDNTTVAFAVSTTQAGAADGMPFLAGTGFSADGPLTGQSLWIFHASDGSEIFHWMYTVPRMR